MSCIHNIDQPYDLFVTVRPDAIGDEVCLAIKQSFPEAHITRTRNVGYDIWPFLAVLNGLDLSLYSIIVKLHTKRSVKAGYKINACDVSGDKWRTMLLSFISSKEKWANCIKKLSNGHVGAVADGWMLLDCEHTQTTGQEPCRLAVELGEKIFEKRPPSNYIYIAGTMFAMSAACLRPLQGVFSENDFEAPDALHKNGLPHIIERLLGISVVMAHKRIAPASKCVTFYRILGNMRIAKIRYKLATRIYGYSDIKTLLARCRYQPLRYLTLPFSMVVAYLNRLKERRYARQAVQYERKGTIRPIAIYLPQFHQIPENDEWWGKGFTEWTNVKKAKPLFRGHYQPHVPHKDIGYYDLSNVEVMRKQAEIAKKYGIYGFCFYYYYFKDGKRLLEKPLDNWLAHTEIDFPFCFCWANGNWTRAWDGSDKEILMPQDYGPDNIVNMVKGMIPAFKDKRYIKVDGKPMFVVYHPEEIPNIRKIVSAWQYIAKENGLDGLHVVMAQGHSLKSPLEFNMDAAMEFACVRADAVHVVDVDDKVDTTGIDFAAMKDFEICERYYAVRKHYRSLPCSEDYMRYKCVCPGWDNTARRGELASFIIDANPKDFGRFCDEAFSLTLADQRLRKDGFVFINAWNEWAEGAHLEPDEKYGYANLEQVAAAIKRFEKNENCTRKTRWGWLCCKLQLRLLYALGFIEKYDLKVRLHKGRIAHGIVNDPTLPWAKDPAESLHYYLHSRPEMVKFVKDTPRRILGVGCGAGRFRTNFGNNVEYWGLEPCEEAAALAKHALSKTLVGSYDAVCGDIPNNYFDLIVCNDVIEHMTDPRAFLRNIGEKLTSAGCMIVSIPNLRNIREIFKLVVTGSFRYQDWGVLDYTHLHLFTKRSLIEMAEECGWIVEVCEPIGKLPCHRLAKILLDLIGFIFPEIVHTEMAARLVPIKYWRSAK